MNYNYCCIHKQRTHEKLSFFHTPFFVYTMSQVQICACTRICIWRMYIIELLSEMVYKVYKSSRSQPARLWREMVCEGEVVWRI